ncbi:MAG: hin [Caulobacteraceae bacterium]|nr:hin [Caulobacteraceae bacterium]
MPLVAYTRVSTGRQQASGLGLEAQQEAIEQYSRRTGEPILATFTEVESGAVRDRPQLAAALDMCRRKKAILLIARLDRLSRSLAFVAQLLDANVEIRAADMPEANRMMLQMLAVFAEHERRLIGERTRLALAAAKARGTKLGTNGAVLAKRHRAEAVEFADTLRSEIVSLPGYETATLRSLAAALNERGIKSREGASWHASNIGRVMRRAALK